MKVLKNIEDGGLEVYLPDHLNQLSGSIGDAAGAFGQFLGQNVYLSETVVTTAGGYSSCDAGWMIYKGEICQFDAQNVAEIAGQSLSWVPVYTYLATDPITFADGSQHSIHETKKVALQYIDLANPPADYVLETGVKRRGLAAISVFAEDWQALSPRSNGWLGVGGNTPYFRKNAEGKVEFKGALNATTATSSRVFTMPAGYRPAAGLSFRFPLYMSDNTIAHVQIDDDGGMYVPQYANYPSSELFLLEAISYHA